MDWTLAISLMLSGMIMVFIGLILLILLASLMGRVLGAKTKDKPLAKMPAEGDFVVPAFAAKKGKAPAMAVQGGIPEETVAVISAAIASVMQGGAYTITNIRRVKDLRPAWGFAGMQQNTKPF